MNGRKSVTILIAAAAWIMSCSLNTSGVHTAGDTAEEEDSADTGDLDISPDLADLEHSGCVNDFDCSDLEPCNGEEWCCEGYCLEGTPLEEGAECITSRGLEGACRDENCIPLTCGNGIVDEGEHCDDGNEADDDGCRRDCTYSCYENAQCDDSNPCTDDSCAPEGNGRLCKNLGNTRPCDDEDPCSYDDTCDGDGNCAGTAYVCEPGVCEAASECDGTGECTVIPEPEGAVCDDGILCTLNTLCDGEGNCTGDLHDDMCADGEMCRPDCFHGVTGCGIPPESVELSCNSPLDPASDSWCEMNAGGLPLQGECLHCEAKIGTFTDFSDFGDEAGACEPDGWELVSGDECYDVYTDGCVPEGDPITCCDNFGTLCREVGGRFVLRCDKRQNCGSDKIKEWRLVKTFDTRGMMGLEFCMDIGKKGGIGTNDVLLVTISDAAVTENVLCYNGDDFERDILLNENIDDVLYPVCVGLPEWAESKESLTVTITAHSDSDGKVIYIDSIALKGLTGNCTPSILSAFLEDFTGCGDPIPDGWKGWEITGEPKCPGFECPGGEGDAWGAEADASEWTMEHDVDTSGLDGDVHLCFDLGDDGSDNGERIHAEFSVDGGETWAAAWYQEKNMTPDGTCRNICVNLSNIDGAVSRNPDMKIRFTLRSDNKKVDIDDIEVFGAVFCDAAGRVVLGAIEEDTPGHYQFSVTNLTGDPLLVMVHCRWDDPPRPVEGTFNIHFIL